MKSKARALIHPIFTNISRDPKSNDKDAKMHRNKRSSNFATSAGVECNKGAVNKSIKVTTNRSEPRKVNPKCPMCRGNHWLVHCGNFKSRTVARRLAFVRRKGLCDNCFLSDHTVKSCPTNSYFKIPGCQGKRLTYLHTTDPTQNSGNHPPNDHLTKESNLGSSGSTYTDAQNACVKVDGPCGLTGAGTSATGLSIIPIKVKARGSWRTMLSSRSWMEGRIHHLYLQPDGSARR